MSKVAVVTGVGPGSLGGGDRGGAAGAGLPGADHHPVLPDGHRHPLELTDQASVATFAAWVAAGADRLDVLVDNAGCHLDLRSAWREPRLVDGHEVHWRTNHLGTAHLTRLLLPHLLDTAAAHGEAWVVSVVARLHACGRNEGLDGHLSPYDSWAAYGTSKLALVHEARELERRYGDRGVHAYSVHPGAVATRIAARGLQTAPGRADHGLLRHLAAGPAWWPPPRRRAEHAVGRGAGRGGRPAAVRGDRPLARGRLTGRLRSALVGSPVGRRSSGVARAVTRATLVPTGAYVCPLPRARQDGPP